MSYKDLFSGHASLYAQYRPHYPPELFASLSSLMHNQDTAWDCATGNGQAALGLAQYFQRVIASDASAQQLAHANHRARVFYMRCLAERVPLASHTLDLVTVAQAAHWFDLEAFYPQTRRVLKPGGVLALWGYGLLRISPEVDAIIDLFYTDIVGLYWDDRRKLVDEAYQTIPFPFDEIQIPAVEMRSRWKLEGVVGMLMSWSAVQKFQQVRGYDPLTEIWDQLATAWGDPIVERDIRWPVFMRIGRISYR